MNDTYCFAVDEKGEVIASGILSDFVSKVYNCPQSHVLIRLDLQNQDEKVKYGIYPKESVYYRNFMG